jgi:hypothetical protein
MIAWVAIVLGVWVLLGALVVLFLALTPRPTNAMRTGSRWGKSDAE